MTKLEFLLNTPDIIEHKSHGYGELEIICDDPKEKGVCYRHKNKAASCGNYASSWYELYEKLRTHLTKEGYLH